MILAARETAPPCRPYRLAAAGLIVGSVLCRVAYLAWLCPLDLAPDEAHYWDWSRHLDWSYYSKGPLVAWLIRLSCELVGPWAEAVTGTQAVAVRLPAAVCGGLLLASLYVLTVQVYRSDRLALAVVALSLTLPLLAAGSSLMTIDAPYTCCWGWALVFGYRAVFGPGRWAWPAAGLCVALGLLAKHTMVLWVPSLGLFLACTPALRHLLVRRGFWVLAAVGALGGLPILVWNYQHDWVTVRHTQGHAGGNDGRLHWLGPIVYVGMQSLVLLGFWFVAWARALWAHRPGRVGRPEVGYLWWMSLPTVAFFGLFSLKNGGGEPNWPVAGYLSGVVLAAAWLVGDLQGGRPWYRRLGWAGVAAFCVLGVGLTVLAHDAVRFQPLLLRLTGRGGPGEPSPLRRIDPTCRLRGWRALAAEVDRLRAELSSEAGDPVLAGAGWGLPGELGFYCRGRPTVYSVGLALRDRHSQYDLWHPNPLDETAAFAGRTFIVVGAGEDALRPAFDEVSPARVVVYTENGEEIARWWVTVGRGYRGFPAPVAADRH